MKKYRFALWDSVAVFLIWIFMVAFSVSIIDENWLYIAFSALASIYFAPISVRWIFMLVDFSGGAQTKETVFEGVAEEERLDVFFRIRYTRIYFDDENMRGGFTAFTDAACEDIRRGDKVIIHYLPKSKIVTEMVKVRTNA